MLRLSLIALIVTLPLAGGCGNPTSTVSGRVRYQGKSVGNGYVTFMPADGHGPSAGGPITDGQFSVSDLVPGKKSVQIVAVKKVNFAASNAELERQAKENAKHGDATGIVERADEIPADAEGNNRQVDLAAGAQTLDFDLMPPKK